MEEIWVDIEGYEGMYQLSNTGKVKSLKRNISGANHNEDIILKTNLVGIGYLAVGLYKDCKGKSHKIHRMLGKYFIPNHDNKPCINHIDGDKLNNDLSNLEWCTSSENNKHAWKIGLKHVVHLRDKHANVQFTDGEVMELRKISRSGKFSDAAIGRAYGIRSYVINGIRRGKTYKYVLDDDADTSTTTI